ncbi:ABC transporter permease [Kaistia dalseonensis]|uniref:NitT/TauT family transport system permease protein n=1 Tax=Kaistia dalseonensis TaxID=410840 RepID=A0ABU0HDP5_9HYPH|nr:ABC transporter permease [Kaistia dalseonensis]MCX5497788.1 ABC transporter permease [Kaistia dalseonensis]MDQ0440432.1 NitT/TauT family transport system permease protein [Kaistia dalseonensis]
MSSITVADAGSAEDTGRSETPGFRLPLGLILPPVLFTVALIAIWAALSAAGIIPRYILPSPEAIFNEFIKNYSVLTKHALYTISEALAGFVIGNCAAVLMAIVFSYSGLLKDAFYPFALISRAIPIIAFTPLLVIVLGRGLPPVIAVVSISVYFPAFLNMIRGLASADVDYHEMMHTLSASRWQRLRIVDWPASIPYLFAALKVSASAAFIGAIVAEWIGANKGLGYLVVISGQYFKLPTLWAAIIVAAGLTLILLAIVVLVERMLHRWTATATDL